MQLLKNKRWLIRISIIIACFVAAMIYQSTKAIAQAPVTGVIELKINTVNSSEITVQVRTTDGKPVQFIMTHESEGVKISATLFHSKVTTVKNIRKGHYNYQCLVKDKVVLTGKYSMR